MTMESSNSLPFYSFKSKNILSSSKPSLSDQMTKAYSDRIPWISMTPEKPANHPGRARNHADCIVGERSERGYCKAAEIGSRPGHQPDKVRFDGKKIRLDPSNVSVGKSKKKKLDGQVKLPEKRFSYGHLAQLKFILPEVIETKKILIHDVKTSCMKPDLHVTLNIDAIKNEEKPNASGNSHMRKVFHARLLDFFKTHPKGEVLEETLQEPFNQLKQDVHINIAKASDPSLLRGTLTDALVGTIFCVK